MSNRQILCWMFRDQGYHVYEAGTGREALDLARRLRPDLILLDVNLPDLSGFEVCRQLREDPGTKSLSIVHLSAVYVGSGDRTQGLEGGADAYLTKPVEPRELFAAVKAMLRIRTAEEAARRAAHQWRTTFDAINDGVCLLDAGGRIRRCNRAMSELLGESFDSLLDRPLEEVLRQRLGLPDEVGLVPAADTDRTGRELRLGGRSFLYTSDPIHDDPGSTLDAGRVVILSDITRHKQLEEQLRQSQRLEAVGRLAGGIAQDFNNLLTAILGNASLLLRSLPPGEGDHTLASNIERAAWRAAELTRQLLGFSRQTLLWLQVVDPGLLLDEVSAAITSKAPPAVRVEVAKGDGLWGIQADPVQLSQVLTHLCLNALDAMPDGGQLTLEAANEVITGDQVGQDLELRSGAFVRFSVQDEGQGIPTELLDKIFDPFFTTKPVGRGSGLGLAMVHGIVKQHQGWVRCHSEPGRGARFEVFLPRAEAAPETPDGLAISPATSAR